MAGKTVKNVISLNALVDKGSNTIIFIESNNDFIDVLFSFLTIPMGIVKRAGKHSVPLEIGCMSNLYASVANIDVRHFQTEACKEMLLCPHNGAESHCKNLKLKIDNDEPTRYFHMRDTSFKGCIYQLHKCVKDPDEHHLKSDYHREIPLSPKIYPRFCYENRLLGIEDGPRASYYYAHWPVDGCWRDILATDKTPIALNAVTLPLKLKHDKSTQGYLKASTAFMVTDKLIIRPASPFFRFSIINELKVPFTDIKEETVEVGEEEAFRLLVATFLSDFALTDEISERFKKMRTKQTMLHTMSRKGYACLEDEMRKASTSPDSITRGDVWIREHTRKSGGFLNE
ncbi:uncharacterized protein LOC110760861 [Prunus avium]|uniref:Uncharacterized protein LOC110760861 n=1 Tax=Prunus avium TaxID=42229 RepID=A0A6P5SXQ7_PRUAV|nr:uncharacterized protein LOC110760861 [Prunus avium]